MITTLDHNRITTKWCRVMSAFQSARNPWNGLNVFAIQHVAGGLSVGYRLTFAVDDFVRRCDSNIIPRLAAMAPKLAAFFSRFYY